MSAGFVSVNMIAGPIKPSTNRPEMIVYMGDGLSILYTSEIAAQWIETLTLIAEGAHETPAP